VTGDCQDPILLLRDHVMDLCCGDYFRDGLAECSLVRRVKYDGVTFSAGATAAGRVACLEC